jgi:hypothetical protein
MKEDLSRIDNLMDKYWNTNDTSYLEKVQSIILDMENETKNIYRNTLMECMLKETK